MATALQSVVGADELVVVDTGSTDRTKEIAAEFGARLFDFPWIDDFAAARNHSLQQCTGDYVLIIDADEELEPGGIAKIREAIPCMGAYKTMSLKTVAQRGGQMHRFPRVFRRCPEVYWKGAIHNYLNVAEAYPSEVRITYGYSEAHKKDPDRALRILEKEMARDQTLVREAYYLAREHWYRKDYAQAVHWLADYLKRAQWAPEMAEAWLMLARCLWQLHRGDEARDACLQAIKINADFREALLFMATMSGPKNRERWRLFADLADNEDVLFVRTPVPEGSAYYDRIFAASRDMGRYTRLLRQAAQWAWGHVLDVCCGTGELGKYIENYEGIDFSPEAIKENSQLRCADVFTADLAGYDTYVILEALEHLDDRALLERIPLGADVVFSVPSFEDPAHIRTYNERIVRLRFSDLLRLQRIMRFNWSGSEWNAGAPATSNYILLIKARRI